MEQVVILLLFVVASIVSSVVQSRNKRRESDEQARRGGSRQPPAPSRPPLTQWPQSAREWQSELRRLIEEATAEKPAPPVIVPQQQKPKPSAKPRLPSAPPVPSPPPETEISEGELMLASPLKDSDSAYVRASGLHDRVQDRMREVVEATASHLPRRETRPARLSPWAARLRDRNTAREAIVASVIFSPPLALQRPGAPGGVPEF